MIDVSRPHPPLTENHLGSLYSRDRVQRDADQTFQNLLMDTADEPKSKPDESTSPVIATSDREVHDNFLTVELSLNQSPEANSQNESIPIPAILDSAASNSDQRVMQVVSDSEFERKAEMESAGQFVDAKVSGGELSGKVFAQGAYAVYHLSYLDRKLDNTPVSVSHVSPSLNTATGNVSSSPLDTSLLDKSSVNKINRLDAVEAIYLPTQEAQATKQNSMLAELRGLNGKDGAQGHKLQYQKRHLSVSVSEDGTFVYARDSSEKKEGSLLANIVSIVKKFAPKGLNKIYINGNRAN